LERRNRAREAIAEMAPPFLRDTIRKFAEDEWSARLAVQGLAGINTEQTRSDLVALYDKSPDFGLRSQIVTAMAHIATKAEMGFLASLLPGRSTKTEDSMRSYAALGIGRIGGPDAVRTLATAPHNIGPLVSSAIATALGNTRDASAVPALIQMYAEDEDARNSVCSALQTLTHYQWCNGSGNVPRQVATWNRWWQRNAAKLRIYGTDACPEPGTQLPMLR
jgi:HEAT repeat protein